MSRKRVLLGLAILAVLASTVAGVLAFLVCHEPEFYRRIGLPPGQERKSCSDEFTADCSALATALLSDREWAAKFTEARINCYLDEDFVRSGMHLPENISQPRIALIEPDRIRLAFRYGAEWWNTVITIDLRLWLVKSEANVVAMELVGLHAGSLPISAKSLLDRVAEAAREQGKDIEVTWYRDRSTSNPVALVRFQASQARPTVRLERLQIRDGELEVGGRSIDPVPLRAMLAPSAKLHPLLLAD